MFTIIVTDLYSDDPISGTTSYQIQKDSVTIGRSRANDVVIRQTNISTKHIAITHSGGEFLVRDLNSTNGTKVNKKPLTGETTVHSDDQIEIGGALIRLTGHPDLERNRRDSAFSDSDNDSEFDDESDFDVPEPSGFSGESSLSGIIPKETGGSDIPGNTGFREAQDFSLSSIAAGPASNNDSPRPSISLDDLFQSQSGGGAMDSGNPDPDFNPFPVDAAQGMGNSVIQEGPEQDKLLAKIRKLENKVIKKSTSPEPRRQPKGIPLSQGSVLLPPKDPARGRHRATPHQGDWPADPSPRGRHTPMPMVPTPMDNPFGDPPPATGGVQMTGGGVQIVVETRNASAKSARPISKKYSKERLVIGRNPDCDICLSSSYISGRHLALEVENGLLMVNDLGSTNGTYLNGQELKEPAFLNEDDEVKMGEFVVTAHLSNAPQAMPSSADPMGAPFPSEMRLSAPGAPFPSLYSTPGIDGQMGMGASIGGPVTAPAPPPNKAQPTSFMEVPKGVNKSILKENFSAVAIQLYLARKAVGKALDELQNSEFESYEIRETCQEMAQAVKILYRSRDLENDFETIQGVVDAVLEKLANTLALVYHNVGYDDPSLKDLYRAYALLLPLSSEGVAAFESHGAVPGLSILSEMGYLGIKHKSGRPSKAGFLNDRVDIDGVLLAGSKFTNSIEYLSCVRALARSVSDIMFLDFEEQLKLENIVDEASTNVIEHAFDTQGNDSFYVSFVVMQENQLAVAVDDLGLPINIDDFNRGMMDSLGLKLIRAFCKEVHLINRGRKGKRLLMVVDLPERYSNVNFHEIRNNKKSGLIADSSQCDMRLATPNLAEEITTCVFRAHRYDYFDEALYRSKELFGKIDSGNLIAAIAVNANNVVIGYMSVTLESRASRVGELGAAIVVPQMNTANVASRLTGFLMEECKRRGLFGLNIVMTAAHPYEQIALTNLGLKSTGMMFSHLPASKGRNDADAKDARQSLVSAYLHLNPGPARQVCLPSQYAAMLKAIYENLGLNRRMTPGNATANVTLPAISNVRVVRNPSLGHAFIKIAEVGDDVVQVIRTQLLTLQKEGIPAIYLDIPLTTPAAQVVCSYLERSKACFSSLVPESDLGDLLRLQLSGFDVDMSALHVEGDFGKRILKGIAQQHIRLTGLV